MSVTEHTFSYFVPLSDLAYMKKRNHWLNHFFNLFTVVLGVYLAFYINEWSKDNAARKEANVLMQSLIDDLASDIEVYEAYHVPTNKGQLASIERVIEAMLGNDEEAFNVGLSEVLAVENYVPTSTTYTSMKAAGKLGLIEDLELQSDLSRYYEGIVVESEKKGQYQADYFTEMVLGWVTNNIDLLTMEKRREVDLMVFRNRLLIYQSLIDQKVSNYEEIITKSKSLKATIESHLH
jgi:hypothetical protein